MPWWCRAASACAEKEPETPDPVVTPMEAQCEFVTGDGGPGGTMRLGAYPAVLAGGSLVARAYGARQVIARREERHTSSGNDSGVRTR